MDPIDQLVAFSAGAADADDVMRSLAGHHGWLAPVEYASFAAGTDTFGTLLLAGDSYNGPDDELWLFTDRQSADVAIDQGATLGAYATEQSGWHLFAHLDARWRAVKVNIGSDTSRFWFIGAEAFPLARLWANAMLLEAWLAQPPSADRHRVMREFSAYTVLLVPGQGAVATAVGAAGMDNPAMVFTAPDAAARVLAQAPQLIQQVVTGEQLFSALGSQGVDGVVFNPLGPGTSVAFDLQVCDLVLSGS